MKFKTDHPEAATIWIVRERFYGVNIKKSDGEKVKTFETGVRGTVAGVHILPGTHVLSLEHVHADPGVAKDPEFKKQRFSEIKVSLEPEKDYTLQYGEQPGNYSVIAGKPGEKIV